MFYRKSFLVLLAFTVMGLLLAEPSFAARTRGGTTCSTCSTVQVTVQAGDTTVDVQEVSPGNWNATYTSDNPMSGTIKLDNGAVAAVEFEFAPKMECTAFEAQNWDTKTRLQGLSQTCTNLGADCTGAIAVTAVNGCTPGPNGEPCNVVVGNTYKLGGFVHDTAGCNAIAPRSTELDLGKRETGKIIQFCPQDNTLTKQDPCVGGSPEVVVQHNQRMCSTTSNEFNNPNAEPSCLDGNGDPAEADWSMGMEVFLQVVATCEAGAGPIAGVVWETIDGFSLFQVKGYGVEQIDLNSLQCAGIPGLLPEQVQSPQDRNGDGYLDLRAKCRTGIRDEDGNSVFLGNGGLYWLLGTDGSKGGLFGAACEFAPPGT